MLPPKSQWEVQAVCGVGTDLRLGCAREGRKEKAPIGLGEF